MIYKPVQDQFVLIFSHLFRGRSLFQNTGVSMFHQRRLVSHKQEGGSVVSQELPTCEFKHRFLINNKHQASGRKFVHTVTSGGISIVWILTCLPDFGMGVSAKAFDRDQEVVDRYKKRWFPVLDLPKKPSLLVYLHPEISVALNQASSELGTLDLGACHASNLIIAPANIGLVLVDAYSTQGSGVLALPVPSPEDF